MKKAPEPAPHVVDVHVGTRVRIRRKQRGMTQTGLADALKLTFQQVQKYERGANRISASKLYEIARTLDVPVQYFFEGLPQEDAEGEVSADEMEMRMFLASSEGFALARSFPRIRDAQARRDLLNLIKTLAGVRDEG